MGQKIAAPRICAREIDALHCGRHSRTIIGSMAMYADA